MHRVGLYLHVPFCPSKCGYCDFYSAMPKPGDFGPLVDALLTELNSTLQADDVRVETIFVGGGTPTFLPTGSLERLLAGLGRYITEDEVTEFTIETNPGIMDEDKVAILRDHGVNRISMGAQSFHDPELRALGRIHQPADIAHSAELIHRAGFEHFNLDLIFGIPGQTASSWSDSIRQAMDLDPDHLACYGLTYEPGTPLHERLTQGQVTRMDEELEAALYMSAIRQVSARGFEQYEISNFARRTYDNVDVAIRAPSASEGSARNRQEPIACAPGPENGDTRNSPQLSRALARPQSMCRHNLRYWHNEPGLGIGPSAASYLAGRRWRNVADTAQYVHRIQAGESPVSESETLSPAQRAGETAMLALRLNEGIIPQWFHQMTGFDPHRLFADPITRHKDAGMLTADLEGIALTPQGRLVADTIIADFLMPAM